MRHTEFDSIFAYFGYGGASFKYKNIVKAQYLKAVASKLLNGVICALGKEPSGPAYVFVGAKYRKLMKELDRTSVITIGGPRQLLVAVKLGLRFRCSAPFLAALMKSYEYKDYDLLEATLEECALLLAQWKARLLVVINDSLPLERLWIAAARKAGVPSVCLQHGLFSESGGELNDGKYVDVMCAYDAYQKAVLENTGARNVAIFGYFDDPEVRSLTHSPVVCILGQPWIQYYEEKGLRYVSVIMRLFDFLETNEIDWVYKPHPSETDILSYFGKRLLGKVYKKSLSRALAKFDLFISVSSTALLEVTLSGKVAIQLQDEVLSTDSFAELGYAYTVHADRMTDSLLDILRNKMNMPFPLDRRPIKERFVSLVNTELERLRQR